VDACTETLNICDIHQVHDVDETEAASDEGWHGLRQNVINDAMYEWHDVSGRAFMSKECILSI